MFSFTNVIIFFIWREYSSVNATTVLIFHMSCFIIIHILPYLYHSDAWPLSHFLTKTHICLVLQSIKEYLVLFWVMYYYLADIFFMSPERISILCCLYSKIAGNVCILLLWHGSWLIVQNVHCVWRNHTIWMSRTRIVKKTRRRRNSRLQLFWRLRYGGKCNTAYCNLCRPRIVALYLQSKEFVSVQAETLIVFFRWYIFNIWNISVTTQKKKKICFTKILHSCQNHSGYTLQIRFF